MSKAKKSRSRSRARLTHFEVRRGGVLCLRLTIADASVADVGDELGALFKKIAPGAVTTSTIPPLSPMTAPVAEPSSAITVLLPETPSEIVISPAHENDDEAYHAGLRARLAELFSSLCDTSLTDALEVVRAEQARRAEAMN